METKQPKFRSPERAYKYAKKNNCKLNAVNEALISTSSEYSSLYARKVLHSRFKLGEEAIAKSANFSYFYSQELGVRFELGEKEISKNSACSYLYSKNVLKSRFQLGEKSLVNDDWFFNLYIKFILNNQIPADILELCSIVNLEYILNLAEDVKNKDEVIKVLFKKKLLNNE